MKKRAFVPVTIFAAIIMSLIFMTTALQAATQSETLARSAADVVVSQPQAATDVIELVNNGDFSSGLAPWWTAGDVTPETGAGGLALTVNNGGSNPWETIRCKRGKPTPSALQPVPAQL